jgi:hypothetical protein
MKQITLYFRNAVSMTEFLQAEKLPPGTVQSSRLSVTEKFTDKQVKLACEKYGATTHQVPSYYL